jgi:glycosyltransferase involved in cell wall biosynthesis
MISYCVTVYNETKEIIKLITLLNGAKKDNDELVIIQTYRDESEKETDNYKLIEEICQRYSNKYSTFHFKNNFAELKNYMTSQASQPYIFNFDADEEMHLDAIQALRKEIACNDIDLYYLPRINIVDGLTEEDIKKWSWNVNERGWVNWPDYQPRIYKNNGEIQWMGPVHEHLVGFKSSAVISDDGKVAILHKKHIDKQRLQNTLYDQIK